MNDIFPTCCNYLFLLTDLNHLQYTHSQHPAMFYLAGTSDSDIFHYSHLYDVYFDIDNKQLFTNNAIAVVFYCWFVVFIS